MPTNDRKVLLLSALKQQNFRCFWCRYHIDHPDRYKKSQTVLLDPFPQKGFMLTENGRTGVLLRAATADHVIPQWLGGQTKESNIVAACFPCNQDRGFLHQRAWYVLDTVGFEDWIKRWRAEEVERRRWPKNPKLYKNRLALNLRPFLEKALNDQS